MAPVLSVAKELVRLSLSGDETDPLTSLRLQKLLYYAQAWSLVVREGELFSEELEAGRHGPLVAVAHPALSDGQGANPIDAEAFAGVPDLPREEAEFVRRVWEAYSPYSALRLSQMTREETPWRKARGDRTEDDRGSDPISVADLEDFFATQTMPAPLAAYRRELRMRQEEAERELAQLAPLDAGRLKAAVNSFSPAAKKNPTGGG